MPPLWGGEGSTRLGAIKMARLTARWRDGSNDRDYKHCVPHARWGQKLRLDPRDINIASPNRATFEARPTRPCFQCS
jgi:hypothetical protein